MEGYYLIRVGIKITPAIKGVYKKQIEASADYFELYADLNVSSKDSYLLNLGIPVSVIHVAHFDSGVNFLDPSREKINKLALEKALELADYFGAEKVVFHPELIEDGACSIDNLIRFLEMNYDDRLIIENMPFSSEDIEHTGRSRDEIEEAIIRADVGFCLDFTHACEYGARMGLDLYELMKELLSLNPEHFHLADTDLTKVFDPEYNETHLNLGEGNMDIETVRKSIPNNSEVTLETPQNMEKQIKEIEYLKDWH